MSLPYWKIKSHSTFYQNSLNYKLLTCTNRKDQHWRKVNLDCLHIWISKSSSLLKPLIAPVPKSAQQIRNPEKNEYLPVCWMSYAVTCPLEGILYCGVKRRQLGNSITNPIWSCWRTVSVDSHLVIATFQPFHMLHMDEQARARTRGK